MTDNKIQELAEKESNPAKTEAKRLIDKYLKVIRDRTDVFNAYTDLSFAKECAEICAERCEEPVYVIPINETTFLYRNEKLAFWQKVKIIIKEC